MDFVDYNKAIRNICIQAFTLMFLFLLGIYLREVLLSCKVKYMFYFVRNS